jgi:muramidase (phage lysozyme)
VAITGRGSAGSCGIRRLPLPLPFPHLLQGPKRSGPLCTLALLLVLPLLEYRPRLPHTLATLLPGVIDRPVVVGAEGTARKQEAPPDRYRITPERQALLNTIRFAEGTWVGGSREGYRMLYGGGRFAQLDRHPEIEVRRLYTSAAAGAYQFLPATWKEAAGRLNLPDFGPASQDQAALYLVEKRGVLASFDRQGLSAEVLARLADEWASLPTLEGGSAYGQPVKDRQELRRFYLAELTRLRGRGRSGFAIDDPAALVVAHIQELGMKQSLDLGIDAAAVAA